jgi:malonate-semialdehyde dehydrogenase (acetylating) / methylmalonate-semialdehyde dehydrogenase
MERIDHWIDGKRMSGQSTRTTPVFNPATGSILAEVPLASDDEVDLAVAAALAASEEWAASSLTRRAAVMFRFRELVEQHRDEIAEVISAEHGKVHSDALGEIARGLECVEFACGIPHLLKGAYSSEVSTGIDVHSIRQPIGVVAGVTPFNFPVMVPLWMLSNALACGNSFILKPSERDPSPSLYLAELLAEAGLPAGVFSVVQGDRSAVEHLVDHPEVGAISFVGSTPVARELYARAGAAGKRVQALGGAKNHLVVLPDANFDLAADGAVSAAFGAAGERCMAISVVVAVGDGADRLVDAIAKRLPELKMGPASDPRSEMGPLITAAHRDRVTSYLEGAEADGAVIVADGRGHPLIDSADSSGFFLGPSLVDRVSPGTAIYTDEIFGPILAVVRVDSLTEAIDLVNANPYGNGVALYTGDGGAARTFERLVTIGMVGINVPIPVPVAYYSFGGWKGSLFGDARMYGQAGIDFYTREKVVTTRWPDPLTSSVNLGFPTSR